MAWKESLRWSCSAPNFVKGVGGSGLLSLARGLLGKDTKKMYNLIYIIFTLLYYIILFT